MNVELHILQNFAPSNLNRDDTGSPKSCEFGGFRRARISSQAIKRAMRTEFKAGLLPLENVGQRSKRLREVVAALLANRGRDLEQSQEVFDAAMGALGILSEKRGDEASSEVLTEVLMFADEFNLKQFAEACDANWAELVGAYKKVWEPLKGKKPAKDQAKKAITDSARKQLENALDGARSADIALFGRMLADLPQGNVDAASQVAHAISTHQVTADFDYYTAVDDRKPEDTAGADMIGTVEFNSACFYRYANIDVGQLEKNLGGDKGLAVATVRAFLRASRDAIPTGKQNSFAARNLPSFVFAVVRESGFCSLANAFVRPVRPRGEEDLVQISIDSLTRHWNDLATIYGAPTGTAVACALPSLTVPEPLSEVRAKTYDELVTRVLSALEP